VASIRIKRLASGRHSSNAVRTGGSRDAMRDVCLYVELELEIADDAPLADPSCCGSRRHVSVPPRQSRAESSCHVPRHGSVWGRCIVVPRHGHWRTHRRDDTSAKPRGTYSKMSTSAIALRTIYSHVRKITPKEMKVICRPYHHLPRRDRRPGPHIDVSNFTIRYRLSWVWWWRKPRPSIIPTSVSY
jgi:hypothetical protein